MSFPASNLAWAFLVAGGLRASSLPVEGGVAPVPPASSGQGFEVVLDRSAYTQAFGVTPGGGMIQAAPSAQTGVGFRLVRTLHPDRSLVWDLSAGLRLGSLGSVGVQGAMPGVGIRSGPQVSGLFGAAFRWNSQIGAGMGLEGRVSSLVTQLDGGDSERTLTASPWLRGFVDLWSNGAGRYLRAEVGYNLAPRHFGSRDYTNARWAPWADPARTPATITTASFWEPRWSVGLVVGFGPARPPRITPPIPVRAPMAPKPAALPPLPTEPTVVVVVSVPAAPLPVSSHQAPLTVPSFQVYFRSGESLLSHEAVAVLQRWVKALPETAAGTVRIKICGHADARGLARQNERLSKRRAEAVAGRLVLLGVNSRQIDVIGIGSREPLGSNRTSGGRALNRRVEGRVNASE